jgi:2'-5' RNA ligase
MGKRNRSNRILVDPRTLEQSIERGIATALERVYTPPPGAIVKPISPKLLQQMQAAMAPQAQTNGFFAPGAPIKPTPGIVPAQGPRGWQYPVGYNIYQLPRSTELTPFEQLRNFANLYDGIGLCERVWFDLCSKVDLVIKPKPGVLQPGEDDTKLQPAIQKYLEFFKKPDKKTKLKPWMQKALKDILELDALAIYKRRTKGGDLYALEIIDGSLIKPLVDERGMEPEPPFPAYQQFVYGLPGMLLRADELIYRRETNRSDSPYGVARVERIIARVNQALRKQNRDLANFTDGNTPAGILEPPADGSIWTPEDVQEWQEIWDALLAGNEQLRSRVKMVPPGWKYIKTAADDILTPFDVFLLNTTVAAFGLTMAELAFTENVNKSSGDTQEAIIYRRAMAPIMATFAEIFTEVMETDFHDPRFLATWSGYEEPEDFKSKVEAWDILVKDGVQSTSQAAHALGLKPLVETTPYVFTKDGLTWVEDAADPELRQAKRAAALAGYQLAQQSPEAIGPGEQPKKENPFSTEKKPEEQLSGNKLSRAVGPEGTQPKTGIMLAFLLDAETAQQLAIPGGEPASELHVTLAYMGDLAEGFPEGKLNPALTLEHISTVISSYARIVQPISGRIGGLGRFINPEDERTPVYASVQAPGLQAFQRKLVEVIEQAGYWVAHDFDYTPHITLAYIEPEAEMPVDSVPILPLHFNTICLELGDNRSYFPIGPQRELNAELRRWRTRAIEDVRRGKPFRGFTTTILAEPLHRAISHNLSFCRTVDEVREVFERAKAQDLDVGSWQQDHPEILAQIEELKKQGFTHGRWKAHPSACASCLLNDGRVVRLGEPFPSGALYTPNHGNCECECDCLVEPVKQ